MNVRYVCHKSFCFARKIKRINIYELLLLLIYYLSELKIKLKYALINKFIIKSKKNYTQFLFSVSTSAYAILM